MMNFGFTPGGSLFMIVRWIVTIVGIILLVRRLISLSNKSHSAHTNEKSPLEILQERYAKGEINQEEFIEKKKDIL